jgi:hypothetical protein
LQHRMSYTTTIPGARAILLAMEHQNSTEVFALKDLHRELVG